MELQELIEFFNFNIKVVGNQDHLFILHSVRYLTDQFLSFKIPNMKTDREYIYLKDIVVLLRLFIYSVS